jgi:peptide-methionine (S)-S-oxide reductase
MRRPLIILLVFMATIEGYSQSNKNEVAILGAGCFWCVEAVFQELQGVESVESGYTGGSVEDPTYKQICTGTTGHAEVAKVTFNPEVVSFGEVLEVFWKTHDPTTLNRQGADVGTQYRSAVFYLSESQKEEAEHYKKRLNESGAYSAPVITEIAKAGTYYPAENYHQDYYLQNPDQGYCRYVIQPKLEKFRAAFADKLKK